ncbi:ribosomal protection-like ABC-F family protein [Clostridium butyricum]|uniref:ribosomal protection-like ABC-F family protein n=1 Tax=Clostridium butyricum TaxID=1492 RepID=UPI00210305BB|nr:ABC-F family ATP-binding cassette domain-containing protein [Clostridium butyricum]MCQ2013284.1 ABC-F family ATP-binding cassette domain-containing protein [Clostridium butyricum]MCQ2027595.1 ABC-F family ATP-binding cassette domain-containing protein [Clostridium butyricum]
MFELAVNKLKKYLDSTQVFEDVSFKIYSGEKVGIVGDNGTGKSTLLKLIAGIIQLTRDDKGDIFIPRDAKISYLEQIPDYSGALKAADILNMAFDEVNKIESEIKELEEKMSSLDGMELERALKKYSNLQESYDSKGGYEQKEKLSRICTGLKITEAFLESSFRKLSGGEKTTLMLGKILLENPDILLLDEPTNHLDMESCEWLEGFLRGYKGMIIIVSHDRYFLDNVVTRIIEIEDMMCESYNGNYSLFTKQKEENMMIQFNQYKEQQKKIEAMEKAIKKLRDWASRGDNEKFFKRAASMQKALDKVQRLEKPKFDKTTVRLDFNETERSGNEVIKVKGLSKKYNNKVLFDNADLMVRYKDRVGIIGSNGCGKTTFLRILLGEEVKDSGNLIIGDSVKYAYLPQNIVFDNEEMTILDEFRNNVSMLEGKAREYLAKFMFFGSDVFKKIKNLSGGERIRVKLSELLYYDINLLILDEPTNHLDINSIDTLEEALGDFKGTILFISHDRYFLNKMSNRIIEVKDKKFKIYEGNYDYYKNEKVKLESVKEKIQVVPEKEVSNEWIEKKEEQKKKRLSESRVKKLEEKIFSLEEKLQEIDRKMIEAGADYEKANKLCIHKEEIERELEQIMKEWEDIC